MDTKAVLKEAKNALKNKDFKGALRLAKSVIKEDRNNYIALFFLGVALQEVGPIDQAPKAFQKAIEVDKSNPLAWQGLINYHEKCSKDESKSELVKLYAGYLNVEVNESKLLDYSKKMASAMTANVALVKVLLETSTKCNGEVKDEIFKIALEFLDKIPEDENLVSLYKQILEVKPTAQVYSSYLTLLDKLSLNSELLSEAQKMHQHFPSNTLPLSWICKIHNQLYIEKSTLLENIDTYAEKLLKIESQNAMALFTQATLDFHNEKFSEAKSKLLEVTSQRPGLVYAWILLVDVLIKLNLHQEALSYFGKAQKLVKSLRNSDVLLDKLLIQNIEIMSLSRNKEEWQKCLNIITEKKVDCNLCRSALIRVHLNLGNFFDAERLINIDESALAKVFKLRLLRKQKLKSQAENFIKSVDVDFWEWWIEVGLVHWELGDFKDSLEPFLKAAKCDSNNYIPFVQLGHFYSKSGQLDKARRCYEKAFKINSLSSEAGSELSKIYRKQKNWEANMTLLANLTQKTPDSESIWAWLQLGLTFLEQGNFIGAVENLRMVIRFEPNNVHCWESLADGYFSRGMFTSALKCYEKALELSSGSLYSTLQVAFIKKILGDFSDALEDFAAILSDNEKYVPALKGYSETCLCLARECYMDQRLGTARDHLQNAVSKATMAILQRSELSCLWKLLGDIIIFAAKLPEKYSFLKISQKLLTNKESQQSTILEQDELYSFSVKCFCKAVSLAQDNPYLWHDLAACYLAYAKFEQNPERKQELFNNALSGAQHCTELNPEFWQHWNLLGNVAVLNTTPNYALAQHSFIKATIAEPNSAISWTNLGVLYMILGEIKLSNKSFANGQRSDPNYVNSWIGQAFLAEITGSSEAMDLFRHSTQLGPDQEGGIGYGHWVCHMLINEDPTCKNVEYNVHNMHAVPVAWDAVNWYTEKDPESGCAWNTLGILSERLGLLDTAKKAFKQAFVLSDKKHRDITKTNYGRLLYRTGQYDEAIKIFSNVEAATFSSGGGLALALFRNAQYEESYAAYEQALHWLTEEQTNQSELLVALASMAYKFQGLEGAKTLLFQSIALKPPSPWSLYATFSLSLLLNDLNLAQLVLKELDILESQFTHRGADFSEYIFHYATLVSYLYLLKNDKRGAVTRLSSLIHRHPNLASSWLILSQIILRMETNKKRLKAGARCASAALKLDQTNMEVSKVMCLASLSFQRAGDLKQAQKFAQMAIHYCPDQTDGWAALISVNKNLFSEKLDFLNNLKPTAELSSWLKTI